MKIKTLKTFLLFFVLPLAMCIFLTQFFSHAFAEDIEGWDKTNWSMSKEDLLTLYKDKVKKIEEDRIRLEDVIVGDFAFEVSLLVDKNRLKATILALRGGSDPNAIYNGIKLLLIQKYGNPDAEQNKSFGQGLKYFDKNAFWFKGKTDIKLSVMSDICIISYQPVKDLSGI